MMTSKGMTRRYLLSLTAALVAFGASAASKQDSVYIGDTKSGTVERFDALNGDFGGTFIQKRQGVPSPTGIIPDGAGGLLVAAQDANSPLPGSIHRFDSKGNRTQVLVPSTHPDAPFAPRGIVKGTDNILYVADMNLYVNPTVPNPSIEAGRVARYDATSGAFLGNLDASALSTMYSGGYHPRGIAFGPDGLLYVSLRNFGPTVAATQSDPKYGLGGAVIRFDTATGTLVDVFTQSTEANGYANGLHRPEGIAFGPDGALYVASFRKNGTESDRILVYGGPGQVTEGQLTNQIALAAPASSGGRRAFAQAMLFGPGGKLYVPVTGDDPQTSGELRRYDVTTGAYVLLAGSAHLGAPVYLTFGRTNPATLEYQP